MYKSTTRSSECSAAIKTSANFLKLRQTDVVLLAFINFTHPPVTREEPQFFGAYRKSCIEEIGGARQPSSHTQFAARRLREPSSFRRAAQGMFGEKMATTTGTEPNAEHLRLEERDSRDQPWYLRGAYISERQGGATARKPVPIHLFPNWHRHQAYNPRGTAYVIYH
jgi:hypothetical protein